MPKNTSVVCRNGIKKIAKRLWRVITPDYLRNLYKSVPRRMATVIASEVHHDKY